MNQIKRLATLSAIFVAACGGGAVAQIMAEKANAVVHKNAPAQATFDTSILSRLRVPAGFTVSLFASGLDNPRMMEVAADGSVYVTRRNLGDVLVLRDADRDGVADANTVFASGFDDVNGVAIFQSQLYLASSTTVWRTPLTTVAPQVILSGLPDGGQHPNRMVRFGPDNKMYVSIGSSCNDCAESNQLQRATMNRYAPDGTGKEVLANGLRNTIGYDWNPRTGALWAWTMAPTSAATLRLPRSSTVSRPARITAGRSAMRTRSSTT
jgi:glucose/arabinose dehydrogenase